MELYKAVTTSAARGIVADGFAGIPEVMYPPEVTIEEMKAGTRISETWVEEYVQFRDMPPNGLTLSRTAETAVEQTGENEITMTISGGTVLADDIGDFVVEIDVPDAVAAEHEVKEDEPDGWPFREFWLPPEVANRYRPTLHIQVSETGEEIPSALFTRKHAVVITERFAAFGGPENPAPVGARCVCGQSWRWSGKPEDDPLEDFPAWAAQHES